MRKVMPQEIEVWYLIPALRKEIAFNLTKDENLTQRDAAKILGTTEATISNYLKSKRAKEVKFTPKERAMIKEKTQLILKNPKNIVRYLYELCEKLRGSKTMCDIHRKYEKGIPKDCDICVECDIPK